MSRDDHEPGDAGAQSVLGLIRDLQSGRVAGAGLSIEDRRRCVEHLSIEGYSVSEIAEVLRLNERTINRDRRAIREANALRVEPELVAQTVGHLVRQAEHSAGRLRRMSRDKEAPLSSRVEAEKAAWDVGRELVQTLQSLGYLPSAPREVKAELRHSLGAAGDGEEPDVLAELSRLQLVLEQAGGTEDHRALLTAELGRIRSSADKLLLVEQIQQLAEQACGGPAAGDAAQEDPS